MGESMAQDQAGPPRATAGGWTCGGSAWARVGDVGPKPLGIAGTVLVSMSYVTDLAYQWREASHAVAVVSEKIACLRRQRYTVQQKMGFLAEVVQVATFNMDAALHGLRVKATLMPSNHKHYDAVVSHAASAFAPVKINVKTGTEGYLRSSARRLRRKGILVHGVSSTGAVNLPMRVGGAAAVAVSYDALRAALETRSGRWRLRWLIRRAAYATPTPRGTALRCAGGALLVAHAGVWWVQAPPPSPPTTPAEAVGTVPP